MGILPAAGTTPSLGADAPLLTHGRVLTANPNYLVYVHFRVTAGSAGLGSTRGTAAFAINAASANDALVNTAAWIAANGFWPASYTIDAALAIPYSGTIPSVGVSNVLPWARLAVEAADPGAAALAAIAARSADAPAGSSVVVTQIVESA